MTAVSEEQRREHLLTTIRGLEQALDDTRKHAAKATRQMHRTLLAELKEAEQRARQAERGAKRARRRAEAAEAELARVRASATWRVGRAAVALPALVRRRLG